jgi:hypothetical protein
LTLGHLYKNGIGTAADRNLALAWYQKAQAAGHPLAEPALYNLIQGDISFKKQANQENSIPISRYKPPSINISIRDLQNNKRAVTVKEYHPETETIELDYQYGSTSMLPLAAFSKESQAILENDLLLDAFNNLDVRFKRERISRKECEALGKVYGKRGNTKYDYDGFQYTLTFRNRHEISLTLQEIDCRFVYEEKASIKNSYGSVVSRKEITKHTKFLIETVELKASNSSKKEIPPFIIESYFLSHGYHYLTAGRPEIVESSPIGLAVRITCEMLCGTPVHRDFYEKNAVESSFSW